MSDGRTVAIVTLAIAECLSGKEVIIGVSTFSRIRQLKSRIRKIEPNAVDKIQVDLTHYLMKRDTKNMVVLFEDKEHEDQFNAILSARKDGNNG